MSNIHLLLEDIKDLSGVGFSRIEQYLAGRHMWTEDQLIKLRNNVAKLDETICVEIVERKSHIKTPPLKTAVVCNACAVVGSCLGAGVGNEQK